MRRFRRFWLLFLLPAFLLPEVLLDPFRANLPSQTAHLLGTDPLGRDGLQRLLLATSRSLAFASAVALAALALALLLALWIHRCQEARSALRSVPVLLFLIPLAALRGGFDWVTLAALLSLLLSLQLEPPLRARLDPFRRSPAWHYGRLLGAGPLHQVRTWTPWALQEAAALFPSAWIGALWSEATLRLLGLGPGPRHDSLGLLLQEELPRLATDPTPLGGAALGVVLALAWLCTPEPT
jgi:ABC-type dipeptide/oligopeptide/nickel transport system permease subunit